MVEILGDIWWNVRVMARGFAAAELLVRPCLPSVPGVKVNLTLGIKSIRLRKSAYLQASSYTVCENEVRNVYTAACGATSLYVTPTLDFVADQDFCMHSSLPMLGAPEVVFDRASRLSLALMPAFVCHLS